ncbi:MAG: hypothetical protein ICV68_13800 [Pyrinomonadaceae bacterium]|nr:hypothetical protein [Pyrinomonadaceae bacterium]
MKTVACPSCSFTNINPTAESTCANCGASLAPALFQQSVDELKKLTDKFQQMSTPRPSFNSFNGFGTTLLDYQPLPDGTYEATRWVIALFLPIFPLAAYIIQPETQERSYGRETSNFTVLAKIPLSAARVLRIYLLAVVALLPVVLGYIYSREINRAVPGVYGFLLLILIFLWVFYIIFFKLKNDGKAYRSRPASQIGNHGKEV